MQRRGERKSFQKPKHRWDLWRWVAGVFVTEVRRVARDACSGGKAMDYRGISPQRALSRMSQIAVRVCDVRNGTEGGYMRAVNVFAFRDIPIGQCDMVDFLAYLHHVRWMEMCLDNRPTDIETWRNIPTII